MCLVGLFDPHIKSGMCKISGSLIPGVDIPHLSCTRMLISHIYMTHKQNYYTYTMIQGEIADVSAQSSLFKHVNILILSCWAQNKAMDSVIHFVTNWGDETMTFLT